MAQEALTTPDKPLSAPLLRDLARTHPDLAWRFYVDNFKVFDERLDPLQRLEFAAEIAASSPDRKRIADLETFARANLPQDARAAIDEAAAAIEERAEQRERFLGEIDSWLTARAG